jgi:hypothetical protein
VDSLRHIDDTLSSCAGTTLQAHRDMFPSRSTHSLNRKQLPAVRIFEVLGLSIVHIRSLHILRCPQHGPQEVFGLLGRIPQLKRCVYVRLPPAPLPPLCYRCIRLAFLRIECERNSTYKADKTLEPDGHSDPSGMLPGSLSSSLMWARFTHFSSWKLLRFSKPLQTLTVIPVFASASKAGNQVR